MAGCGGDEASGPIIQKAPVSGKVTQGGKPLAGVEVNFMTEKFAGVGKTDEQGRYTLVQGAEVGENKVYITKIRADSMFSDDPEEGMDDGQLAAILDAEIDPSAPQQAKSKSDIPPEYSDPQKTILKFTVPAEGAQDADFNLP